jgi:hypothetical protein
LICLDYCVPAFIADKFLAIIVIAIVIIFLILRNKRVKPTETPQAVTSPMYQAPQGPQEPQGPQGPPVMQYQQAPPTTETPPIYPANMAPVDNRNNMMKSPFDTPSVGSPPSSPGYTNDQRMSYQSTFAGGPSPTQTAIPQFSPVSHSQVPAMMPQPTHQPGYSSPHSQVVELPSGRGDSELRELQG